MIGIELDRPCAEIVEVALKEQLLVNVASGNVVRVASASHFERRGSYDVS